MNRPMIRQDRIWLRRVLLIGLLLVALIHLLLLALQGSAGEAVVAETEGPIPTELGAHRPTQDRVESERFRQPRLFRVPGSRF